jgi:superfamily II DNA helicase RecQ
MPTSSSKSLIFMLLAYYLPSRVTIVVVLLIALEGDIVRRYKESDIKCIV